MPILELHLLEGYESDTKRRLGEALTDAVRLVVPVDPELVTVLIHEYGAGHYMRGREPRTGAAAFPDPAGIVHSFLDAMERRDLETARGYLGEGFEMTFPGTESMKTPEELIAWSRPRYRSIAKSYESTEICATPGSAVVYTRGTLRGEWPDGTRFEGIRFIDRFEVAGGLITRQDVWNDIAEVRP